MSLTKEKYLEYLEEEAEFYGEGYEAIKQLINDHFELEEQHMKLLSQWGKSDNPPLRFEELKVNMWVWDNDIKKYLKIVDVIDYDEDFDEPAFFIVFEPNEYDCFEENRFYRREVKE